MKLILPGGSGFLGRAFANFATAQGHRCVILTRQPQQDNDILWDGKTLGDWVEVLSGATAVVNFTGKSVNCVYTEANKKTLIESRVKSVQVVEEAIRRCTSPPTVVIQVGSLAIYGDTREMCSEEASHGEGFSVHLCEMWEESFFRKALPQTRKCLLRVGFVLGPNGGVLKPLRHLTRCFLGGTVGPGTQYISWLHIDDLNHMILTCIEEDIYEGVFNATGPTPVMNRDFMKAMRKVLGRPWSPPAPTFLVKIGANLLLNTEASLALTGRKCFPKKLTDLGFEFQHTNLEDTLHDVMNRWGKTEL